MGRPERDGRNSVGRAALPRQAPPERGDPRRAARACPGENHYGGHGQRFHAGTPERGGVDWIYGYAGDGINGILGALARAEDRFEFIQVPHEEVAAFIRCEWRQP
jgi:hypothetical protein